MFTIYRSPNTYQELKEGVRDYESGSKTCHSASVFPVDWTAAPPAAKAASDAAKVMVRPESWGCNAK